MAKFIIIWTYILVVLVTPIALVSTALYVYFHESRILKVVLKLIAALIGYLGFTAPTAWLWLSILFADSQKESATGRGLGFRSWISISLLTIAYAGICYLLVCLVKGSLFNPWKLFSSEGNNHISIFESKER